MYTKTDICIFVYIYPYIYPYIIHIYIMYIILNAYIYSASVCLLVWSPRYTLAYFHAYAYTSGTEYVHACLFFWPIFFRRRISTSSRLSSRANSKSGQTLNYEATFMVHDSCHCHTHDMHESCHMPQRAMAHAWMGHAPVSFSVSVFVDHEKIKMSRSSDANKWVTNMTESYMVCIQE